MTRRERFEYPANRVVSCANCALAQLCLARDLPESDLSKLDTLITRRRPLKRHQHLFDMDDPCRWLYAVRSGAIKTSWFSRSGEERVIGLHLPGELVGLDAFDNGCHSCTAIALESSSLCQLPYGSLQETLEIHSKLNVQIHRLIGEGIRQTNEMLLLLGRKSAEQRLANFLLNLSSRCVRRGFSPLEFNLSMSRHDIANFLGLALGTVSRLLGELQEKKVLIVEKRRIRVLNMDYLWAAVT